MCGIFGAVHQDRSYHFDEGAMAAALATIRHRGPDDSGLYFDAGVVLGSQRLAILDLSSAGHMPMSTADGRYWITYNGEIYNFHELRGRLEARGYQFKSHTDTEVLLNLYADIGPDMLSSLNGMFAFAIWDAKERKLFAARDRLGVKPFYYSLHAGALWFASEQKALLAAGVAADFDHSKWEELLCFRF